MFYFQSALKRIFQIFDTVFEYVLRSTIKNTLENEDDPGLFLSRPNFIWKGIIIPFLLIKAIFFSPEGIYFSS